MGTLTQRKGASDIGQHSRHDARYTVVFKLEMLNLDRIAGIANTMSVPDTSVAAGRSYWFNEL